MRTEQSLGVASECGPPSLELETSHVEGDHLVLTTRAGKEPAARVVVTPDKRARLSRHLTSCGYIYTCGVGCLYLFWGL